MIKVAKKKISKKTKYKKLVKTAKTSKTSLRATQPHLKLEKSKTNPIISPNQHTYWEGKAVFNPAAVLLDDTIHLVYRAVGWDDNSVLGYLNSPDPEIFDVSKKKFCYTHKKEKITKKSKLKYLSGGGGEGGCEDPRLTNLDDKMYLLYTAFNGWDSVRIAMSSIDLEDFKKNNWNWSIPVFLSPPGQVHKNWVLFPEKINGKYAFLHAISPKIMIEYVDDLNEFDGENFIYSVHQNSPLWAQRDRLVRGVGPTPIKTEYGWLIFYHGMDPGQTHKYKLYAMLLDLNDPTKVIAKSKKNILEPEEVYENSGIKPGIVYCCGAVVKEGKIYIYYGAADNVICVASTDYKDFLNSLMHNSGITIYKHSKIRSKF